MEDVFDSSKESLILGTRTTVIPVEGNEAEQGPVEDQGTEESPELDGGASSNPGTPAPGALCSANDKEAFSKFRAIVNEYLNGEMAISIPEGVVQSVLSSFSLAGYLDHAIPTGKDIIITKLLQQCCFQLQDLLRFLFSFLGFISALSNFMISLLHSSGCQMEYAMSMMNRLLPSLD